jgi:hypothetical protein
VALAAGLAVRVRDRLGLPESALPEVVRLLASPRTRPEATEVLRRADPARVVRALDPYLSRLEPEALPHTLAVARVYEDALRRGSIRELDPRATRRAAVVALLPATADRSPQAHLEYLALAGRLGHPIPVAQVEAAADTRLTLEGVAAYARALAATGDPAAAEVLHQLATADQRRDAAALGTRLAVGKALVDLGDRRGLRLIIDSIGAAPTSRQARAIELELARLVGVCPGHEMPAWERWWREEGRQIDLSRPPGTPGPCFRVPVPTLVIATVAFLAYLVIALVNDRCRWGNFLGVVVLTTGLYLILAAMIRHNLALAGVPFVPYGDRHVMRFVDQVLLPYNTLLFLLLTVLQPWGRRPARP